MQHEFIISFSSNSKESRPPLSYKIREYYSSLLEDKLFKEKLIVLKDGWCINLVNTRGTTGIFNEGNTL